MFRSQYCFRKSCFVAANQPLYMRILLSFLAAILMSLYVLPFAGQAHADDIRDLDSLEALANKWEEVKTEGLSAGDVKKLTDKLKELGGDDIDGTGVGELLDDMNTNADKLAKLKDAADKLDDMIDVVENLKTGDPVDAMEALGDVVGILADLMEDVPPPFGTIAGPMLKAYSEAIKNGLPHARAIQAATRAKNAAIAAAGGQGPGVDKPEDGDDSFEWDPYPYPWCPDCELAWWIAGNSEVRASALEGAYEKAKETADALSEQAQETHDRLVKEYREKTAERMANEQEVLFDGKKVSLIDAFNAHLRRAQRLKEKFEEAEEHAKKMRQAFLDCLEKCVEQSVGANWSPPTGTTGIAVVGTVREEEVMITSRGTIGGTITLETEDGEELAVAVPDEDGHFSIDFGKIAAAAGVAKLILTALDSDGNAQTRTTVDYVPGTPPEVTGAP